MRKASWKALTAAGLLLSTAVYADDAPAPESTATPATGERLTVQELLDASNHASRWKLRYELDATQYSTDWPTPLTDLNFEDSSALSRASRLRSLSLLTLADSGGTRLFFGVNEEGVLGLHFSAHPKGKGDQQLEMTRMPYLSDMESDRPR